MRTWHLMFVCVPGDKRGSSELTRNPCTIRQALCDMTWNSAAKNATLRAVVDLFFKMRTKTETATVTRFGIDPPMATRPSIHIGSFNDAVQHVGAPAFGSTIMFLMTAIAVFLSTAAVTYLLLQSKGPLMKVYHGLKTATPQNPEQDKKVALQYASTVTLCHVLVIFVLVVRAREALVTLAPVAYEVCALILGIEAAVCVVAGAVWGVVKLVEYGEAGAKAKGA
ncbi:hypothetical protein PRZ48_007198 [Zasmidium cellare]|uniref:Uncharacterized protein n=1 Tax=Zasmidium cellare TaxID=395010 RepID=A0ABR0EJ39_ZASCE|nr:hypothetical protein PRZ48_007198 [Zasmidium cellare]